MKKVRIIFTIFLFCTSLSLFAEEHLSKVAKLKHSAILNRK